MWELLAGLVGGTALACATLGVALVRRHRAAALVLPGLCVSAVVLGAGVLALATAPNDHKDGPIMTFMACMVVGVSAAPLGVGVSATLMTIGIAVAERWRGRGAARPLR